MDRGRWTGRRHWRLTTAVALAVALGACGSDSDKPRSAAPTSTAESTSSTVPAVVQLPGRIMFSRFDESTHTFVSTHVINPDGSGEVELKLPGPDGGGRWSHDGKHIAVMRAFPDKRLATAIITPDGTVERLLPLPDSTINLVCEVWSPDDSRLACEGWDDVKPGRGGIYTVRSSDGSDLQRLTTTPEGLEDAPGDYSPDAKHFIFKRAKGEDSVPLTILDLEDKSTRQLSTDPFEDPGRYSPDGTTILTSGGTDPPGIVTVNLDGKVLHRIVIPAAAAFGPSWSPDGAWIAFSLARGGPFADVYTSHPDGSTRRQVTRTPANEILAEWGASAI